MLGDALRLRRWHTGDVASSQPGVTIRLYPMTQVVSRRCAVLVARCFSIASTVQCHGLVSARRRSSSARGAPCCDVLGVLCGVLCLGMPFGCAGDTQVPWRHLGPGDRSNVPHGTGGVASLCSLGCPGAFRLRRWYSVVVLPGLAGAVRAPVVPLVLLCPPSPCVCLCVILLYFFFPCPLYFSGSLEPYLVLGCKAYRQQMNTIQVGRILLPPVTIQKKKSDVYSFGVVLVEILTWQVPLKLDGPEVHRSLSSPTGYEGEQS